jgi:hypothetical protein
MIPKPMEEALTKGKKPICPTCEGLAEVVELNDEEIGRFSTKIDAIGIRAFMQRLMAHNLDKKR